MVEAAYWVWRSSDWHNQADEGGTLDQDRLLQEDLLTYHQLYSAEEDKLDEKKKQRPSAPPVQVVLYNNLDKQKGKAQ